MAVKRIQDPPKLGRALGRVDLLTPDEAAAVARCSVKTVRRAYASGALVAYRRRGSRAVLLDRKDVHAWVHGELVQPEPLTEADADPSPQTQSRGSISAPAVRAAGPPDADEGQRFDLSPRALRARRAARA